MVYRSFENTSNSRNYEECEIYSSLLVSEKEKAQERDKIINRNRTDKEFYLRQANYPNVKLFAPILNYKVDDIWSTIKNHNPPTSLSGNDLELIYKMAGEAPDDVRNFSTDVLKKGRFGCWTCTVIRKDKAVNNLICNGFSELEPLLHYRNWLSEIREDKQYRCSLRRNGQKGPGPFTLEARYEMLEKLLETQENCGIRLIEEKEIKLIKELWNKDLTSSIYIE